MLVINKNYTEMHGQRNIKKCNYTYIDMCVYIYVHIYIYIYIYTGVSGEPAASVVYTADGNSGFLQKLPRIYKLYFVNCLKTVSLKKRTYASYCKQLGTFKNVSERLQNV
jgi:hypothetical protein